jgi:hypothetical protein
MYGSLLAPPSPMGSPPAMKPPVAGPSVMPPPPGPPPAAAPTPQAGAMPPGPTLTPGQIAAAQTAKETAQLEAYSAQQDAFLRMAAHDYVNKRISRDDLKKAASYTGTQPYADWRNENVQHIKETAKANE